MVKSHPVGPQTGFLQSRAQIVLTAYLDEMGGHFAVLTDDQRLRYGRHLIGAGHSSLFIDQSGESISAPFDKFTRHRRLFGVDAQRDQALPFECAASALNHPNILTVYEIGRSEEAYFIVTEFVDGETLRRRLDHGPLGAREVVEIAIQIAGALAATHKAGIVHRDIKPENIMTRRDEIVKVLDFGLAKLTLPDAEAGGGDLSGLAGGRTAPGVILGTLNYMPPEQARGSDVDQRSDLFCLGIVLYELIAGRLPFTGDTPADVIAAILEKQPPPLARENSGMPPELGRIVTATFSSRIRSVATSAPRFSLKICSVCGGGWNSPRNSRRHGATATRRGDRATELTASGRRGRDHEPIRSGSIRRRRACRS